MISYCFVCMVYWYLTTDDQKNYSFFYPPFFYTVAQRSWTGDLKKAHEPVDESTDIGLHPVCNKPGLTGQGVKILDQPRPFFCSRWRVERKAYVTSAFTSLPPPSPLWRQPTAVTQLRHRPLGILGPSSSFFSPTLSFENSTRVFYFTSDYRNEFLNFEWVFWHLFWGWLLSSCLYKTCRRCLI